MNLQLPQDYKLNQAKADLSTTFNISVTPLSEDDVLPVLPVPPQEPCRSTVLGR